METKEIVYELIPPTQIIRSATCWQVSMFSCGYENQIPKKNWILFPLDILPKLIEETPLATATLDKISAFPVDANAEVIQITVGKQNPQAVLLLHRTIISSSVPIQNFLVQWSLEGEVFFLDIQGQEFRFEASHFKTMDSGAGPLNGLSLLKS